MSRRLTLHVKPELEAAIDRITAGNGDRRRAVERLILDRGRHMREQAGEENSRAVAAPRTADGPAAARTGEDSTVRLIERLRESRDRYRELAVRAEAALLGVPVRDDYGSIEHRLERALRDKGFEMPAASGPRRRVGSRRREGR